MVFNNRMKYAFDPVPFENQGTMLKVLPVRYETQPHLIVLEKNLFDNHKMALYCYNMQGERVTEKKEYENATVPSLPAALLVHGHIRQGNYRVELEDIVRIAWVEE
jgi:hypothetical protein